VYVPNEYTVWLSPEDRARYEGVEHEVIDELSAYLLEHARREDLILASPPHIEFDTDERLSLGEFGIQARLVRAGVHSDEEPRPADEPEEHGHTMIYSTSARVGGAVAAARGRPHTPRALLSVGGRRLLVPPDGGVLGRSRDCDVVLDDSGVSRRHAEVRPDHEGGWTIQDLGSTNGATVNGQAISGIQPLQAGDRIGLGSTELLFELG
jgi:predicted component of type VI protein secretion system